MKKLIQLYIIVLFVMLATTACILYGFVMNDTRVFLMGDMLGIPFSFVGYFVYRKEYHEVYDVWRFK